MITEDNGILVPPGDSKSLADAIEKIVSDRYIGIAYIKSLVMT